MPELPDITVYIEALERRILGRPLQGVRLGSPFVLRSVEPPLAAFGGRVVRGLSRLGKRIVIAFDGELYLVIHLMIRELEPLSVNGLDHSDPHLRAPRSRLYRPGDSAATAGAERVGSADCGRAGLEEFPDDARDVGDVGLPVATDWEKTLPNGRVSGRAAARRYVITSSVTLLTPHRRGQSRAGRSSSVSPPTTALKSPSPARSTSASSTASPWDARWAALVT